MKTDTYKSMYGATHRVYPYKHSHAHVDAEHFAFTGEARRFTVNWPSIGGVSIEEARQFAAAINAACDWLEQQKEEVGNG